MTEFKNLDGGKREAIPNLLESVYLGFRKVIVKKIRVVKFGMDNVSNNRTVLFGATVVTVKLKNVRVGME